MKIAVAADERVGVAEAVLEEVRRRGHEPLPHGALSDGERDDWAWASEAAARDVAEGRADQAVVCCWNDANVLALSLLSTSAAELAEILDAWLSGEPSGAREDRQNVAHLGEIEAHD